MPIPQGDVIHLVVRPSSWMQLIHVVFGTESLHRAMSQHNPWLIMRQRRPIQCFQPIGGTATVPLAQQWAGVRTRQTLPGLRVDCRTVSSALSEFGHPTADDGTRHQPVTTLASGLRRHPEPGARSCSTSATSRSHPPTNPRETSSQRQRLDQIAKRLVQ